MRLSVFGSIAGFRAWGFGAQGDSYDSKLSDPMGKLGIGARVRGQSELAVCRKAVCWVPKLLVVQGGHTCEMCRVGMSPNARIQETREIAVQEVTPRNGLRLRDFPHQGYQVYDPMEKTWRLGPGLVQALEV